VDRAEREAILTALEWTRNNKTRAAELLGVSVRTLWYKIRGLGLANQTEPESRRGSHPE
jgi:transcriptional regulator with PAS, ATPase and Fis domain